MYSLKIMQRDYSQAICNCPFQTITVCQCVAHCYISFGQFWFRSLVHFSLSIQSFSFTLPNAKGIFDEVHHDISWVKVSPGSNPVSI